ncbi:MAG: zinc-ribbon domain-containing protein [Clostridia bacterium]|nr:zinc-ribbon domain-containing protein [Clostridia bacterium]
MFCNKCGKENNEDSRFCSSCGAELKKDNGTHITEDDVDMFVFDDDTVNVNETKADKTEKKNSKKRFLCFFIPVIAVILIAVIIVSAVIAPYYGPMTKIMKAVEKTVNAESFSFKLKATEDDDVFELEGTIILDFKKKDITMYGTYTESGTHYDYYDGEYEYINEGYFGIYDGIFFEGYYDDDVHEDKVYGNDISEVVETCFETYEESGDYISSKGFDYDKLFEKISDLTGEDIDRDDVEEYVDLEILNDSLKEAWKSLNNKKWLEENLNYEKKRDDGVTYYSFEPDYDALARSAEEIFSDAIVDDDFKDLSESGLDEIVDEAKDDDDFDINATIGIKKGCLHEATFKNGWLKAKIEFSEVGSAKLNEKVLQEYVDIARLI